MNSAIQVLTGLKNEINNMLFFFCQSDLNSKGFITVGTYEAFQVQKVNFPDELIELIDPSYKGFLFNKCGVCVNPEIIYHFILPNDLAWRYLQISICNYGETWSFGISGLGTSFAATKNGKFKSRAEAVEKGIAQMKINLDKVSDFFGDHSKHKTNFYNWLANRNQLSLF